MHLTDGGATLASPSTYSPSRHRLSTERSGRFVVHLHDARWRHYDIHLEIDGSLVSWAMPDSPSMDPAGPSARQALAAGHTKLYLLGDRIVGGFVLLRTELWRPGDDRTRLKWLLIHRRDDDAIDGWVDEDERSLVATGRTNDDGGAVRADTDELAAHDRYREAVRPDDR